MRFWLQSLQEAPRRKKIQSPKFRISKKRQNLILVSNPLEKLQKVYSKKIRTEQYKKMKNQITPSLFTPTTFLKELVCNIFDGLKKSATNSVFFDIQIDYKKKTCSEYCLQPLKSNAHQTGRNSKKFFLNRESE